MPRVLVVDDEASVRESLRMLLKTDCDVATAGGVDEALTALAEHRPDLVLLDLLMPGRSGLELLSELQERGTPVPVIVLTATASVAMAVEAMKLGASDFVTKPFEIDALRIKVRQLLERNALVDELERLREQVAERQSLGAMLGRSAAMLEVFRAVERIAQSRASVLITGESGTGKELAARAIHEGSPRKDGPFIAINCGAIPPDLIESELFGHEKGAFTGAHERHVGHFEAAQGGTVLLDEIGELAPPLQVKLLRALQERQIQRVGGTAPIDIDVRVLAATNRDLEQEVAAGRFREDLFYRINVVPLELPPLRERREDIRLLAEHFLEQAGAESGRKLSFARETLAALEAHRWPGNVRELENAVEHAATLSEGERIELSALPPALRSASSTEALRDGVRQGTLGFDEAVSRFERELLREALERHGWNQTRTAAALGITRRQLKLRMDRLRLVRGAS